MQRFKISFLTSIILFTSLLLKAQIKEVGVPFITNYTHKTYEAASENWDVQQDSKGILYFANHFGLLQFDGVRWRIIAKPKNRSMVRSVAIDKNGRVYMGGQGDFGYNTLQSNGQYHYTSLIHLIPKADVNFGDVWHIFIDKKRVYFYTKDALFIYCNNAIKCFKPKSLFEEFFIVNNKIYLTSKEKGLFKFENDKLISFPGGEKLIGMGVKMIFGTEKKLTILTQKGGFFFLKQEQIIPWHTEADYLLKEGHVSCAINLPGDYYAVGTRENGLVVIDKSGHLIQHINKNKGLQNDFITNLKSDINGDLWLTLTDGIDFVEIDSPFSRILDRKSFEPKIYSSLIFKKKLYIATDNGIFKIDWEAYRQGGNEKLSFQPILGTFENIWDLKVFDNTLLAFGSNGTYQINESNAQLIGKTDGAWTGVQLINNPNILIVGGYTGIYLYKKENTTWKFQSKIKGFQETSRVMTTDQYGNLWIAHGYKGVYKIQLNKTFDAIGKINFYDQNDNFPSSIFLKTFKINNQILFGTLKGVYKYDSMKNKMSVDITFKKILGLGRHVRLLEQDCKKNIWFIAGDNTGIIHPYKKNRFKIEELPFRKIQNLYIPGFENIQTTNNDDVFFGTQYGLIHYSSSSKKKYKSAFNVIISEVRSIEPRDSVLYSSQTETINLGDYNSNSKRPILAYSNNSMHFFYAALWYKNVEATKYQYWLEGFESSWSDWNKQTEKEYTNLPENKYVFHIRAKNMYDIISKEDTYKFEILPPWYRTNYAYSAYILLFGLMLYAIIKYQNHLAILERKQLIANQEKEILLKEAELNHQKMISEQDKMNIIQENLKSIINLKNAKVASNAVNLIHLNEILLSIKEHVNKINLDSNPIVNSAKIKKANSTVIKRENSTTISRINRIINHELKGDDNWKEFEEIFNQIHDNFTKRLKNKYPELTPRDIRLCAYLRMNLKTKEIAPFLGISVRGVEDTRYRIRKKLKLPSDANITEFILHF
jgi:ligand-binding sensor domain-containing protein/DNA-binding CsgD family transcriptional regulator